MVPRTNNPIGEQGFDAGGAGPAHDTAFLHGHEHIMRLRKKLGPVGEKIATGWGVGYRFTG